MVSTGRRQRHDDRGADHRARGEAGHLRGRVRLDELRRRDLHHPAAGRARDHRAGDLGGDRARGRGLRRRPRGQRGPLARAGTAVAAAADQPGLRGPRGDRRLPGGAGGDAAPAARRTPSGPSPASAATTSGCSAWRCCSGRPGIRTGLEDVAYISRGVHAPSNAALVEMAVGLAGALGREVATQAQTPELLAAWLRPSAISEPAGALRGRRAPRPARAGDPRGDRPAPRWSCSRGAATTRRRCGRSPRRPRCSRRRSITGIPARRRSWSASRTTSWSG